MNTIKFSSIYELKKETNNVEIFEVKDINFDGINYKYYSNAQISLYVTKKCNGKCPFCMNNYEERYCKSKEINDQDYLYNFDRVLDKFKNIKPYITITGGEPTKNLKLIPIIRKIKKSGFKTRTFATNGTGLFDRYERKTIISHLLENGVINNINVSRMVIDDLENEKIMGIKQSNREIERIFTYGRINNMDIRLSCNLQKYGVKNLNDIINYIDFYNNIGVETVMFRELIPFEDETYKKNIVSIKPIFQEIENNKQFKYLRTLEGMYYIVKVYRYKDKLVKCYKEKKINKINNQVIREFVFYPDGNLDGGWNKKNNILLKMESRCLNE